MIRSFREPRSEVARLQRVLNSLPRSVELLRRGVLRTAAMCRILAEDFVVLRFAGTSGRPALVYVHANGCAPTRGAPPIPNLSATNGSVSGRITWALIRAVRYPFDFPAPSG